MATKDKYSQDGKRPSKGRPSGRNPSSRAPQGSRPSQNRPPQGRPNSRPPQGTRPPNHPNSRPPQGKPNSRPPQKVQLASGAQAPNGERRKPSIKTIRKIRKRRKFLQIHKLCVTLSVLFVFGTVFWKLVFPLMLTAPSTEALPLTSTLTGVLNGDDSHYQRKKDYYTFLLVGSDDGHGNADTIIVASYDALYEKLNLISVPRDTLVYRTWSSFPKINSAYSKGVDMLKEEVSYTLGIPIDFHVTISLEAFIAVVDELGGIDYNVPQNMYHDDEGGFIIDLKAGEQHLDGRHTLELVRYRGYATADIGRTETQQAVLKVLAQKALSWGSITKIQGFLDILEEYVDTNLSSSDFFWFAQSVLGNSDLDIYTQTLVGNGSGVYNGTRYCYELDKSQTVNTVNHYLNPYTTSRSIDDMTILSADNYNS